MMTERMTVYFFFGALVVCFRANLRQDISRIAAGIAAIIYLTAIVVLVVLQLTAVCDLIIVSPNYLGELTASFRALYERLIFRSLTYNRETPCCNERPIPVLLMMTSNAPDTMYLDLMRNYRQTLGRFVGPTEIFVSGDTLQLKDYGKTDWQWTMFDPEAKQKRHDEIFPQECRKAFELGAALALSPLSAAASASV